MKKEWLQEMKRFCEEESGVGVVEIILEIGRASCRERVSSTV